MIKQVTITVNSDFELVQAKNSCQLLLDQEHSIIKISWKGKVGAETASFLLSKALNIIKEGDASTLLLDRTYLDEFSKGARMWIKEDFLTKRVKPISHLIEKIATVKPITPMGGIFSNLISAAIKIVMPFMKMAEFRDEVDACQWLVND